ncbi:MAG: nucleotidyltransferase domain-containing protein [Caldithrix sp.]|nr:MAG: nucleotidyltransferase domain-containing protein [Caldithrix sp.]
MPFPSTQKENIKKEIRDLLSPEQEITKIIIFGSFIKSTSPRDIDIAVFQDSNQKYMPLSLKYRRLTRKIAKILPLDVIPIKASADNVFINEIEAGEIIYER